MAALHWLHVRLAVASCKAGSVPVYASIDFTFCDRSVAAKLALNEW